VDGRDDGLDEVRAVVDPILVTVTGNNLELQHTGHTCLELQCHSSNRVGHFRGGILALLPPTYLIKVWNSLDRADKQAPLVRDDREGQYAHSEDQGHLDTEVNGKAFMGTSLKTDYIDYL
jgi:hypothetical protein